MDTVATRTADPFDIAEQTKADLLEADKYWKGRTTSELATSYMAPEAIRGDRTQYLYTRKLFL